MGNTGSVGHCRPSGAFVERSGPLLRMEDNGAFIPMPDGSFAFATRGPIRPRPVPIVIDDDSDDEPVAKYARSTPPYDPSALCGMPYVDKQTNEEEAIALQRLTQIAATRAPVLVSPAVRRGKGYKVRMTNKGTTLDAMGGRRTVGGKEIVIQRGKQLEGDLRVALTEIRNAGIRHLDLPMRGQAKPKNITWDGANFSIIDFDKVEFSSNWSVEDELQEVLSAISVWANSRDDYGRLPGARR